MKLPIHIERRYLDWLATNKTPPSYQSLAEFMYNLLVQPNNDTLNMKRNSEASEYSQMGLHPDVLTHAKNLKGDNLKVQQYLQEVSYTDGFNSGVKSSNAMNAERIESHHTFVKTVADLMITNQKLALERIALQREVKQQGYALVRLSNETLKPDKVQSIAKEGMVVK